MEDYQRVYEDFWKNIIENRDGTINLNQLQKELSDYYILLDNVPKVYEELSGLSKPFTDPRHIINKVYEKMIEKQIAFDDLMQYEVNRHVIIPVSVLKGYFDIQ